jgi:RimJ/RimL family protein N-acetyltransferase
MDVTKMESKRLKYRPFMETDYDDLYDILSNKITCHYLPGVEQYTKEQVQKWLTYFISTFSIENRHVIYAITTKDNDKVIGYTGCNYVPEFKTNEIKYIFHPDFFGKGYATEAAQTMKDVAKELGFKWLVGLADVDNIPSQVILKKIGYTYKKTIDIWGGTMKYYELELNGD